MQDQNKNFQAFETENSAFSKICSIYVDFFEISMFYFTSDVGFVGIYFLHNKKTGVFESELNCSAKNQL